MNGWDAFLTEQDKAHVAALPAKQPSSFGKTPCVLVIDDYYSVLGFERLPILESIKTWPGSTGLEGWAAIDETVGLLASARENDIPVIYCHGLEGFPSPWGRRRGRRTMDHLPAEVRARANEIVEEIAPQPGDVVIKKSAPSVFHGTPLMFHLNYEGIDSILACG